MRGLRALYALIAIVLVLALGFNGEDPYRFFTWKVTYGHIYPLGVKQQVYPRAWTAIYIRSENWERQYLRQQLYQRVYSASNTWRDEYSIPRNALLCGRARGRCTRPV